MLIQGCTLLIHAWWEEREAHLTALDGGGGRMQRNGTRHCRLLATTSFWDRSRPSHFLWRQGSRLLEVGRDVHPHCHPQHGDPLYSDSIRKMFQAIYYDSFDGCELEHYLTSYFGGRLPDAYHYRRERECCNRDYDI